MNIDMEQNVMSELLSCMHMHTNTHRIIFQTHTHSLGKRQRQMCPQNANIWLAHYCRHKHTDTAKFCFLCLSSKNAPQWSTHSWNPVLITATHIHTLTLTRTHISIPSWSYQLRWHCFHPTVFPLHVLPVSVEMDWGRVSNTSHSFSSSEPQMHRSMTSRNLLLSLRPFWTPIISPGNIH